MSAEASLSFRERLKRKCICVGAFIFCNAVKVIYRFRSLGRPRLIYVDHITFPCTNLADAEAFYVGLLGAKIMMRIDRAMLSKMGWSEQQIAQYQQQFPRRVSASTVFEPLGYPLGSAARLLATLSRKIARS